MITSTLTQQQYVKIMRFDRKRAIDSIEERMKRQYGILRLSTLLFARVLKICTFRAQSLVIQTFYLMDGNDKKLSQIGTLSPSIIDS